MRRAVKKQAIPAWANLEAIDALYELARWKTERTGIEWQVDHVVPLQSPSVCGLHVENNLEVLTKKRNASKGNRRWPGQ